MAILFQHRIFRADLRANPHALYLFGDNLRRRGMGGQAGEMRGEPNALGVATKTAPGMAERDFFSDAEFDFVIMQMARDLTPAAIHVKAGGLLVIPLDGLGTGLSQLPTRGPRIHAWLQARLAHLGA